MFSLWKITKLSHDLAAYTQGRWVSRIDGMYLPENDSLEGAQHQSEPGSDTPRQIQNPMLDFEASPSPTLQNALQQPQFSNSVRNTRLDFEHKEVKTIDKPARRITEIRVFYDDQTWETFVPQKKS